MKRKSTIFLGILIIIGFVGVYSLFTAPAGQRERGRLFVDVSQSRSEDIEDIQLRISTIRLQKQNGEWITLNTPARNLSIIGSGTVTLLSTTTPTVGTYERFSITIDRAFIRPNNGSTTDAYLPTNRIEAAADIQITEKAGARLTLDFFPDHSLHRTQNGRSVFAPVIGVKTAKGVYKKEDGTYTIGTVLTDKVIGVEPSGTTTDWYTMGEDAKIRIQDGIIITEEERPPTSPVIGTSTQPEQN